MVYEKCIIWTEINYLIYMAFYGKQNIDYAACLTNAVKFLLVLVHKMNFLGVFLHAFTYANAGL